MTYCIGMMIDAGLVLMSDTRTNSGVDNISQFRKSFTWSVPGDRVITLMTAGNLATTQSVVSQIDERNKVPEERSPSILEAPTMFQVARSVGELLHDTIRQQKQSAGMQSSNLFNASVILAGQIAGMEPRLFLVYPEGNFIEATEDTPFFQVGETKYGRPIIVRAYDRKMSFEDAAKLAMVSMDSTLKANLSVGMPLDLTILKKDLFEPLHERRIEADNDYFQSVSAGWGDALREAFNSLPDYTF